jgi:two-component system, NtrC family, sensor histidine kinase HydH
MVLGDKDLIYRAVYNVLANALQAMHSEGKIRISVETSEDHLTLVVRDSGPGIDQGVKDKLVDPFFTTKETGTGLGLSIVNSIMLSHDGRLHIDNHPQGGAVVRMTFPRSFKNVAA